MRNDESAAFASSGFVRLGGFHPRERVEPIRRAVLEQLKHVHRGRGLPRSLRSLPAFQQIAALSRSVEVPGLHAALMTPELSAIVAGLGGRSPGNVQATQLLLSPPQQGAWTLQGLNWHVDVAADARGPVPGVQAFFLIDDVAPHGGATLALAGSHRPEVDGPALRRMLRMSTHLEQDLDRIGIGIIEMAGRAGDVFLMDMRLLHTPSINATRSARIMATTRCLMND